MSLRLRVSTVSFRFRRVLLGLLCLSWLLPATTCMTGEADFVQRMAKHTCRHIKKCDRSRFVDQYDDNMEECHNEVADDIDDYLDTVDGLSCDFDEDEAAKCEKEASRRRNECGDDAEEEVTEACEDVTEPCGFPIGLSW